MKAGEAIMDQSEEEERAKLEFYATWRPDPDIVARAAEAAGGMFRWFLAAMLALNGGALISLLSHPENQFELLRSGATSFTAGLIMALMSGQLAGATAFGAVAPYLNIVPPVSIIVERTGSELKERSEKLRVFGMFLIGLLIASQCLAIGSFVCFLNGTMNVAQAVFQPD